MLQFFAILPNIAPALMKLAVEQEPKLVELQKKFMLDNSEALENLEMER